ncbi:MAG: hypothetical protein ACK40R_06290 [Thermomonas sp.]
MPGFRFTFDLRSVLALVMLCWLASFAHEFTHHLAGLVLCGPDGRMSLSLFALADGCGPRWPWATAAGPALSYLLMWIGMALLLRGSRPWWGLALVIANKPLMRLLTAAAGGGDEGRLWSLVAPQSARWLATATVLMLVLPPLWACWRALPARGRGWVLPAALLLPMLPLLGVPAIDTAVYGDWIHGQATLPAAFGVPYSVWAIEVGVCLLFLGLLLGLRVARRTH